MAGWGGLAIAQPAGPAGERRAGPGGAGERRQPAPRPGGIVRPRLVKFARAEYPPQEEGRGASVGLRLTIGVDGAVVRAEIVDSASPAFDESARRAALRFRFRPAERGGRLVASRILYRYEFRPRPGGATAALGARHAPGPTRPPAVVAPGPQGEAVAAPGGAPGGAAVALDAFGAAAAGGADAAWPQPTAATPVRAPVEVEVRGRSAAQERMRSGEAVTVLDLQRAHASSADLGEAVARAGGVTVRRMGGLGSRANIDLGGLGAGRVRFFLDGLPLGWMGHALGAANVPVNSVQRLELYRGVTPVRLGGDGLGGAVNLVTDRSTSGTRSSASAQVGSFGQARVAGDFRHRGRGDHVFVAASAFLDSADNDYPVVVDAFDEAGRVSRASRRRFHDGYGAFGGRAEVALLGLSWANRLSLEGFGTSYQRDIQHNLVMTVPYGDVTYDKQLLGGHLAYAVGSAEAVALELDLGYSVARTRFVDMGQCRYDWDGRCAASLAQPGEIAGVGRDSTVEDGAWFGRATARLALGEDHELRISASPRWVRRRGRDRALGDEAIDPLRAEPTTLTATGGVELESRFAYDRLRNQLFAKAYLERASSLRVLPSGLESRWERGTSRVGVGNGLRLELGERLYARASYEWATRLPTADELFGDGGLTLSNLELVPERSHNLNIGLSLDPPRGAEGVGAAVSGFARFARDLIFLVGEAGFQQFDNAGVVRVLGAEANVSWTAPGGWLSFAGGGTALDARSVGAGGGLQRYAGERMPNQPRAFAHGEARVARAGLLSPADELSLSYSVRYVGSFFRGWELDGLSDTKSEVPEQALQSIGLVHQSWLGGARITGALQVDNLADAAAFDFFGVQRPGRSFHLKLTVETGRKEPST